MTLAFAIPEMLLAFLALPLLWLLFRFVPPQERRERFPPVSLLLPLGPGEPRPRSTPWWLILLRLAAVALIILSLARPSLDSFGQLDESRPLLLLIDGGWASAPDWDARQAEARAILDRAERAEIPVALARLSDPPPENAAPEFRLADEVRLLVSQMQPRPWPPSRAKWAGWLAEALSENPHVRWLHDGIHREEDQELFAALENADVTVTLPATGLAVFGGLHRRGPGGARVEILTRGEVATPVQLEARDSSGNLLAVTRTIGAGPGEALVATLNLPSSLLDRVGTLRLRGHRHAAALRLLGESWNVPTVGFPLDPADGSAPRLLRGEHYVRAALAPVAEFREAPIAELATAATGAIVLADRADFSDADRQALEAWVEGGGVLVRFAGDRFARWSETGAGLEPDPLLPARILPGNRELGGALSWQEPQPLARFHPQSPFAGLDPSPEILVRRQVLAAPDIELDSRVWAELADRTPLVTANKHGKGQVILFHSTADPAWSSLSLTGGFADMLVRLLLQVRGENAATADPGRRWTPDLRLNASGNLAAPEPDAPSVPADRLNRGRVGPDLPPGVYRSSAGAHNLDLYRDAPVLGVPARFPPGMAQQILGIDRSQEIGWMLLLAAAVLLLADGLIAAGSPARRRRISAVAPALLALLALPGPIEAQTANDEPPQPVLGYVVTGDAATDATSRAGLTGLARALRERTSIFPGEPAAVRLGRDDISALAFLYWPVLPGQGALPAPALESLTQFLATGGLAMLDTRDGGVSAAAFTRDRVLRQLALPPLSPAGPDHVITQTFYLLREFPGRWTGGRVWVVASAESDSGDQVSPVLAGSADWASAWGETAARQPVALLEGGATQREMAIRSGINFVMYALTGNYKADQVHVPTILDRLGIEP